MLNNLPPILYSFIRINYVSFYQLRLGLTEMFSDSADLRGMFDPEDQLKVSDVVHKAVIEIDEAGSEATSATGKY